MAIKYTAQKRGFGAAGKKPVLPKATVASLYGAPDVANITQNNTTKGRDAGGVGGRPRQPNEKGHKFHHPGHPGGSHNKSGGIRPNQKLGQGHGLGRAGVKKMSDGKKWK